jgi:hypothetical protein
VVPVSRVRGRTKGRVLISIFSLVLNSCETCCQKLTLILTFMYTYTYMYTYMCIRIHIRIPVYVYVYPYTYTYTYVTVYVYIILILIFIPPPQFAVIWQRCFTLPPFSILPGLPYVRTMARLAILQTKKNVIRVDFVLELANI